jgi:hypothetical protein
MNYFIVALLFIENNHSIQNRDKGVVLTKATF